MDAPLDLAWEQINALGGVPTNPAEEAVCDTINKALDIIEKLGGSDPASKRASSHSSPERVQP